MDVMLRHEQVTGKVDETPPGEGRLLLPGAEPFFYPAGEVGCLLVHGFTSTPHEMRALGAYLAEQGITSSGVLLAGHGTRPSDLRGTTWQDWYASVDVALDEMLARCSRVYVAGLSLGGALTLYAAAHRGDQLAGIVVMSTPIYLPRGLAYVLVGVSRRLPYLRKPFRDIQDPVARGRHVSYLSTPVDAIASLVDFLRHVRAGLSSVRVPALVIYSRHDHVVPPFSSRVIYARLGSTDKQIMALQRGYHIVTVDRARRQVFEAVLSFISERERTLATCKEPGQRC